MLIPSQQLKSLQDENKFTELMIKQEEVKFYPVEDVWNEYLERCNAPYDKDLFYAIDKYEKEILAERK